VARQSTAKASRTSLEPSEIFCAVGLKMPNATIRKLCSDNSGNAILAWAPVTGKGIADGGDIDMGANRPKFLNMFNVTQYNTDNKKQGFIANVVAGFSAAIGIKGFLAKHGENLDIVPKVHLTGARWGLAVQHLRLFNEDDGFDYNSSDLIIEVDELTWFGISLKKKKNVKGADPTLINKAFTTLLKGDKFDTQRESLLEARKKYFAGIVRKAQQDGLININLPANDEDLWELKTPDPTKNGKMIRIINLKGSNNNKKAVELTDLPDSLFTKTSGVTGLRDYINQDLSKPDNELYAAFAKIMLDFSNHLALLLIDTVLKTQMQSKLRAQNIGDMFFEFALVTGYADFTLNKKNLAQSKLNLNAATVIPQHSILCGLANLQGNRFEYKLVPDTKKKEKASAAKIFYQLKKQNTQILDMELRYKGDFSQQPQFFATLAKPFITQMLVKCEIRK